MRIHAYSVTDNRFEELKISLSFILFLTQMKEKDWTLNFFLSFRVICGANFHFLFKFSTEKGKKTE